jgi:hypothetical protein
MALLRFPLPPGPFSTRTAWSAFDDVYMPEGLFKDDSYIGIACENLHLMGPREVISFASAIPGSAAFQAFAAHACRAIVRIQEKTTRVRAATRLADVLHVGRIMCVFDPMQLQPDEECASDKSLMTLLRLEQLRAVHIAQLDVIMMSVRRTRNRFPSPVPAFACVQSYYNIRQLASALLTLTDEAKSLSLPGARLKYMRERVLPLCLNCFSLLAAVRHAFMPIMSPAQIRSTLDEITLPHSSPADYQRVTQVAHALVNAAPSKEREGADTRGVAWKKGGLKLASRSGGAAGR